MILLPPNGQRIPASVRRISECNKAVSTRLALGPILNSLDTSASWPAGKKRVFKRLSAINGSNTDVYDDENMMVKPLRSNLCSISPRR